jgi:aromatic-amino-acid transaminase
MFNRLVPPPEDALHGVMARYAADKRPEKIDLGVGVFRNETGKSPIMRAVLKAEHAHLSAQTSKSYLSLRGDPGFLQGMHKLAFNQNTNDQVASIQSVGGTGAIRLALELALESTPEMKVIVGLPTWPNHLTICEKVGVKTKTFTYFNKSSQRVIVENVRKAILEGTPGDVIVLHGPCHNPSGADLSDDELFDFIKLAISRGLIPLIDIAYYGLGEKLNKDLERLRALENLMPRGMIAMSCSKAFGLYRERLGILFVKTESSNERNIVQGTLERMARGNYSMAPAHGAAVVSKILASESLYKMWFDELTEMRDRLSDIRAALTMASDGDPRLDFINKQQGIFSLLPITTEDVEGLARSAGIYMPKSGRINIAGFKTGDVNRFCEALSKIPV